MFFIKNKNNGVRKNSAAVIDYQNEVALRERNIHWPEGVMFTNDFDLAMEFKNKLLQYIPDLYEQLSDLEVDAFIDLVADETCKDLRQKGLLSKDSKNILGR